MFSVDLTTRPGDGYVVVELHGELDVVDAAAVATAIAALAVREPEIVVDLAALEFIDSSGVAALGHYPSVSRRIRFRPAAGRPGGRVSTYRVTGDVARRPAQAVPPADQTDRSRR